MMVTLRYVFVLLLSVSFPAVAGVYFETTTVMTGPGFSETMEVEGWADGSKSKIVFRQSTNPLTGAGTYLITHDGGKMTYLIDPKDKTYMEWDIDQMMNSAGGVMNALGGVVKFKVSDPHIEIIENGKPAEKIAGYSTKRYRYRTTYTSVFTVMGFGSKKDVVIDQIIWSSEALKDVGLSVWLRKEPPKTGNPDLDGMMSLETNKVIGYPLKMETVSTETKKGKQTVTKHTMTVNTIKKQNIKDATFVIPADYQKTSLMQHMGSETGPSPTSDPPEEEQGGLKGLFNRGKSLFNRE